MPSLVTLTSDFEERDPYASSMKGVVYTRCPGVQVADLSHQIPRGNILEGALFIAGSLPFFPKGTVHVVVVAPGRPPIAVSLNDQFVLCPDNGVITLLAEHFTIQETRAITNSDLVQSTGPQTFFGREVFAPAAAHLAGGASLDDMGAAVKNVTLLNLPQPEKEGDQLVRGRIMHVDRFGNLVTNIHCSFLDGLRVTNVEAGLFPIGKLMDTYGQVGLGCPVALYGSAGYLEIAYNGDRADARLNIGVGINVNITVEPN